MKGTCYMRDYIILHVKQAEIENDPMLKEALTKYSSDSFSRHSDLAIEIFTVVLTAANFIVSIMALPYIVQLIDAGSIVVSFNGFELENNWKKIIRDICRDPNIKDEFTKAFENQEVNIKGQSSKVLRFYNEIKEVLSLNDNSVEKGE